MADTKISDLAPVTSIAAGDLLVLVDVDDPTMGAGGTDYRMTLAQLFAELGGDVSASGFEVTIGAGAVTAAKLAAGAAASNVGALGGDLSGTLPNPTVTKIGGTALTLPLSAGNGGTGQSTYATGDILYAGGASAVARLAGNASTARQYLTSTGTGAGANPPAWAAIAAVDLPVMVASGASHAPGAAPDPGASAGTTRFLREDATWAVPAGGSPGGSSGQLQVNNAGAFGGAANLTVGTAGQLNLASQSAPGAPANGDIWHDSTNHALTYRRTGLTTYLGGLIYSQVTPVTATAAASTSLINATGALGTAALPAGVLNSAGRELVLEAFGYCTTASSPGQMTLSVSLGGSVVATTLLTTFNASKSNFGWALRLSIKVASTGATGTINAGGAVLSFNGGTNLWTTAGINLTNGTTAGTQTPGTPVTADLTSALALDLALAMTQATNSFTLTGLSLKVY